MKKKLRSQQWFGGNDKMGFVHRSWLRNQGYPDDHFRGKPVIGICNTWSELTPCNGHLRDLAMNVRYGILEAGGFPLEFPVMSLGETIMRPTTMLFRNLASMDVEESIRANPLDGIVLLTGCDKTTPSTVMGACSVDLPTIVVPGGPMLNGKFRGGEIGSGSFNWMIKVKEKTKEFSDEDFLEAEICAARSAGHCNTMGTASSMATMVEILGLTLPGASAIPAVDARKKTMAQLSGRRIVEMVKEDLKLSDILTREAFENGTLTRTFITNMEAAHLSKIANDIETYLMWGKGGRVKQDGPDDIRLSVGLWSQLDNSFKRIYNKSQFTLDMFKSELYNFYQGKVEFKGPDPQRKLVVQTGIGGMQLINKAIANEVYGSGLVQNASDIGAVTGKGMDLDFGFAYTSFTIPFLANVKFVLNPAFDNLHTNDIENPLIDGRPLSSFSFIIFDVTEEGNDNIFLLKLSWDNQLKWFYQNGTMDYMGRTQGFQSSGQFNGYRVFMSQTMPAVWVKDPTKVLKIVMRNPITGGSF